MVFAPLVPEFFEALPGMTVDIVTEGRLIDIVAEGFDRGPAFRGELCRATW